MFSRFYLKSICRIFHTNTLNENEFTGKIWDTSTLSQVFIFDDVVPNIFFGSPCGDHKRVWNANLLQVNSLPNPLCELGNDFVCKSFVVQSHQISFAYVFWVVKNTYLQLKHPFESFSIPTFFINFLWD